MTSKNVQFGGSQLRLKKFNIKDMCEHATIAMIAKRASGKSYLTREILYHKRDIPTAVVVSKTEKLNKFYGEFIPDSYIFEDFDTSIAEIDAIEGDNSLDMLSFQFTMEQTGTFTQGLQLEDHTGNIDLETATPGNEGSDNLIGESETGGDALTLETGDYIIQESYVVDTVDENAMNDFFEKEDDNILDFSESNPFGDIGKK